jgi:hypothetical protein
MAVPAAVAQSRYLFQYASCGFHVPLNFTAFVKKSCADSPLPVEEKSATGLSFALMLLS